MKSLTNIINEALCLNNGIILKNKNNNELNVAIKSWYKSEYPNDDIYKDMPDDVTFMELLSDLVSGKDCEKYFGNDSITRERIFRELSLLIDVHYSKIYNTWLHA